MMGADILDGSKEVRRADGNMLRRGMCIGNYCERESRT